MKLLRAVLGRLDAWAALLLGVLLALGVVILLATPGPWHEVVGPAPAVERAPRSPTDLAVFATAGRDGACTGVLWAHVDHEQPTFTAVVVAPATQGFVAGGGFMPLTGIVDVAGPAAAATALGQAVGVHMDAWLTLDDEALRLALSAAQPAGAGRARVLQFAGVQDAWTGVHAPLLAWTLQAGVLSENLRRVPYGRTSIIGFANYVLGFGHIRSDLDLQRATSLARTFKLLLPSGVRSCALPAVEERCRRVGVWRVDPAAAASIRRALAAGELPPAQRPLVTRETVPARVLVVFPGRARPAAAYVTEVRRRLRASAGAPVAVRAIAVADWSRLAAATVMTARAWRPLAVLAAPPSAATSAQEQDAAAALQLLGRALRVNRLPAVLSEPLPAAPAVATGTPLGAAVRAGGQPVSPLDAAVVGDGSASRRLRAAAAANVATLVRACWSGALAPRLASTRMGFSFAARRRSEVGVVAPEPRSGLDSVGRLATWGFPAAVVSAGDWTPAVPGDAVYYRPGLLRAAFALAGDLGLPPGAVLADADAPAPVTLVLSAADPAGPATP